MVLMELVIFINGVCVGALAAIMYDICVLASEMKKDSGRG